MDEALPQGLEVLNYGAPENVFGICIDHWLKTSNDTDLPHYICAYRCIRLVRGKDPEFMRRIRKAFKRKERLYKSEKQLKKLHARFLLRVCNTAKDYVKDCAGAFACQLNKMHVSELQAMVEQTPGPWAFLPYIFGRLLSHKQLRVIQAIISRQNTEEEMHGCRGSADTGDVIAVDLVELCREKSFDEILKCFRGNAIITPCSVYDCRRMSRLLAENDRHDVLQAMEMESLT